MRPLAAPVLAALALIVLALAATALAEPLGSQVRVSQVGADGNANFDGGDPALAYNPQANQYLAVWEADDSTDGENEVFGRFINAGGSPVGGEFRISDMGPDGDANYDGQDPAVAYNSQANEYLVVWEGDDNTPPLVEGETEAFGQRLSAGGADLGAEIGANDFRISDMGPDGNINFDAFDPAVAHNSQANEYLVVWEGDDAVDQEAEIYGQRLSAAGAELGANDVRLSDMGPDGNINFAAFTPAVAYNSQANEFLAVWEGEDTVDEEFEIHGQRISSAGNAIGANDFRISNTGPDPSITLQAADPALAYNSRANEYLAVWEADNPTDGEFEIWGQRLSGAGAEVGASDLRISDMGPDGNDLFEAVDPAVAYGSKGNEYLVLWEGDDDAPPLADGKFAILGQRIGAGGTAIGENDFLMSQMGPNEDPFFDGLDPAAAYGTAPNQYLGAWEGDDNNAPLVDGELEIYARRSTAGDTADRRRPSLRLRGSTRQRFVRQRGVVVFATSDENVTLRTTTRLTVANARSSKVYRLKRVKRSLRAGKRTKVKVRISTRTRRAVRRALSQRRRVVARVTVRVTDPSGNSTTRKRTIRGRR